MSELKSLNNGSPMTSIFLEKSFFTKNYKNIKKEMEPDEIIDFLVQYKILDTDDDTHLLRKSRAKKCDYILRKFIRDSDCRLKLVELLHIEAQEELHRFRSLCTLLCDNAPEPEDPFGKQGKPPTPPPSTVSSSSPSSSSSSSLDSQSSNSKSIKKELKQNLKSSILLSFKCLEAALAVLSDNLKRKENEKRLLEIFRIHAENILDDFLQEDVISVDEHEHISLKTNRKEAAEALFTHVANSPCLIKLIAILKSYGFDDLVGCLQQTGVSKEERKENVRVTLLNAEMTMLNGVTDIKVLEVKITTSDGRERIFVKEGIHESERNFAQKTHFFLKEISEGSIIILLETETGDAIEKLRHYIESGGISLFLEQYFKREDVQKILKKDSYRIKLQIKKVQSTITDETFERPKHLATNLKTCLTRCHDFLLEELQSGYFLRDKEIAPIFEPVRGAMDEMTNRADKINLLLKHLKEQPEERIKLVLDKLRDKNSYICEQLFPNTEKFDDIDIEQVKRNIFDNLEKLMEEFSIDAIRTPFLSTGIISSEELDSLRSSNEYSHMESLQFVKLVVCRGAKAIKIFLRALEISCSETLLSDLLKKTEVIDISEDTKNNDKIKCEAFDENSGLLFTGNFLLETSKEDTVHLRTHISHADRGAEDSTPSDNIQVPGENILRCHQCKKADMPLYCDDCRVNLRKRPTEEHLCHKFSIHQMVPVTQRWSLKFCKESTDLYDLVYCHQDVLHCHVCQKPTPPLYCELCHSSFCKDCAGKHLFDKSIRRKTPPIKRRWSVEYSNPSTELCSFVDDLPDGLRCCMCHKPDSTWYCALCDINLCKDCFGKHLSDKFKTHEGATIKHRWSDFTNQYDRSCNYQSVFSCQICQKPNPPWYCDLCHIHLCRVCAGTHLSDQFKIHEVVPIKNTSLFEFAKRSTVNLASVNRPHDPLRCNMCNEHDPLLYCSHCQINLCKVCARKHLFGTPRKHKLVLIKQR